MKNALNYTTKQEQLPKVKFTIFDRFKSGINTEYDVISYTRDENLTQLKNEALRKGYVGEYGVNVLWCPDKKITEQSLTDVINLISEYQRVMKITNIPYFVGDLKAVTTIDYGDAKIDIGTGMGQKLILEVIERRAIEVVGYFDVRLKDFTSSIDYTHRLAKKKLMPVSGFKATPWMFDINHQKIIIDKPNIDEYSSQWFLYKYESLPWEENVGELKILTEELKRIKQ